MLCFSFVSYTIFCLGRVLMYSRWFRNKNANEDEPAMLCAGTAALRK